MYVFMPQCIKRDPMLLLLLLALPGVAAFGARVSAAEKIQQAIMGSPHRGCSLVDNQLT